MQAAELPYSSEPDENTVEDATSLPEELIVRVCALTSLDRQSASHLVQEMLHFYSDTPEEFIIRRHRELQQAGLSNKKIYAVIEHELEHQRFHSPKLSVRQIRRAIYG